MGLVAKSGESAKVWAWLHFLRNNMSSKKNSTAKLSVFKSVFGPIPTSDHISWVMTERMLSRQVQPGP